jgi:hypothetical protein
MKAVILTHGAAKGLDAPAGRAPERDGWCQHLRHHGQGDVKKLAGREGYRLRIGACRVISGRGCPDHSRDLHRSPRHHDL